MLPQWFSTPLGSPLSFGLRPVRARKRLALCSDYRKIPHPLNPHPALRATFPQGKAWWYQYCGQYVYCAPSESFFERRGAPPALQGKREEREEGVKPAQLVVHPPCNYATPRRGAPITCTASPYARSVRKLTQKACNFGRIMVSYM